MTSIGDLKHLAEIHYFDIIKSAQIINFKLRLILINDSFIDINLSSKIPGKFGFHWETKNDNNELFRYDNFPDIKWQNVETYPFHFHYGSQENVIKSPFPQEIPQAFHAFMKFVRDRISN